MKALIAAAAVLSLCACSSSDDGKEPANTGGAAGSSTGGAAGSSGGAAGSSGSCAPSNWPTSSTVGIPSTTPALKVIANSLHTKADGEVYDAVDLQARLYVDHKNVTIKRSRLQGDQYYAVYTTIADSHLTIEDSEIVGGVLPTNYFTARRNHIHAPAGGSKNDGFAFAASNVLIEDNLIDGLSGSSGAHLDGIQTMAGSNIVLRHNWIEAVSPPISGGGVNAAIFFSPNKGPISDVTVECNMLIEKDGYYPLRIYSVDGSVVVRHNRWQKGFLGTAPVGLKGQTSISEWTDNAYDDGTPIASP